MTLLAITAPPSTTKTNTDSSPSSTPLMFSNSTPPPHSPTLRYALPLLLTAAAAITVVYFVDFDYAANLYARLVSSSSSSSSAINTTTIGERHYYTRAKRPLPACADNGLRPAKSFLIVFMSRSGSTAISQTMAQHPRIEHGFEYLKPLKFPEETALTINKTREFFQSGIAAGRIPGFKIRALHINANPSAWAALTQEFDTRVIWQYRKNVFKTALGIYARTVLNDSTATGGIGVKEMVGVKDRCDLGVGCSFPITQWKVFHEIMTGRIRQDTDMMKAVNVLDGGRNCMFELPYEDYLYDKEETLTELFRFLGLKATSMETFRVKATGDSLCEVVDNFDELCEKFYGCPIWQAYLDDFDNDCRCTKFQTGTAEFCSMYAKTELDAVLTDTY